MFGKEHVIGEKGRLVKSPFQQETRASKRQQVLPLVQRARGGVYVHDSALPGRQQRRSNRAVRFGCGTKEWCGLRADRHFTDEIVHQFFVLGKQFSSVDVLGLIGVDAALVAAVGVLLRDLCDRIAACPEGRDEDGVPVLLEGGGRGMKVARFHLPYLQSLAKVVEEAARVVAPGSLYMETDEQLQQQQQQQQQQQLAPMIDV